MIGRLFPFFSFCLYLVALNVYSTFNVWGDEYKSSCLVLRLQSAEHLERSEVPKGGWGVQNAPPHEIVPKSTRL